MVVDLDLSAFQVTDCVKHVPVQFYPRVDNDFDTGLVVLSACNNVVVSGNDVKEVAD